MAAPGRGGPSLDRGPGLLRASPAKIAHNGPSPPAGALYCLPLLAALQPLLGPLGCSVTMAPGLLLPMNDRGWRGNLDKRKIQRYEIVSTLPNQPSLIRNRINAA